MVSSKSIGSRIIIILIIIYQRLVSPLFKPSCRFSPTCSQYGISVLHKFGLIKGSWLMIKRIVKCHPLYSNK